MTTFDLLFGHADPFPMDGPATAEIRAEARSFEDLEDDEDLWELDFDSWDRASG